MHVITKDGSCTLTSISSRNIFGYAGHDWCLVNSVTHTHRSCPWLVKTVSILYICFSSSYSVVHFYSLPDRCVTQGRFDSVRTSMSVLNRRLYLLLSWYSLTMLLVQKEIATTRISRYSNNADSLSTIKQIITWADVIYATWENHQLLNSN